MKKTIEIDLDDKFEYLNKYDDNKINDELHEFILESMSNVKQDVILKIKFNYKINKEIESKVAKIFNDSFREKLLNIQKELNRQKVRDFILLILGFLFLAIYCCLDVFNIFLVAEFFMVISWVAFWEFAESLLFDRRKLVINRKKYQKLMNAEFDVVD